jgi:hypothetical protein
LIKICRCLCKINIINLDDLVSSSTAQISKIFSWQLCEITCLYKQKYRHPPAVDFDSRNFILIYRLVMWDVAGIVRPCDAH